MAKRFQHRTMGGIAAAVFPDGDTPKNRRIIERWASLPREQQPVPIERDGRILYIWEEVPDQRPEGA
jgi:hypothetical protein